MDELRYDIKSQVYINLSLNYRRHLLLFAVICLIFPGIVKATKGQYAEALVCYNRALKYRKRYANCYYNLGNLHLTMNNSDLALQSWSQSLAINAKHSPSWANMLTLLDNQGLLSISILDTCPNT